MASLNNFGFTCPHGLEAMRAFSALKVDQSIMEMGL